MTEDATNPAGSGGDFEAPTTPSFGPPDGRANPASRALPAPDPHALQPGATIAQRYRIVSRIGGGGMGDVYRADDLTLGVAVALKFLAPHCIDRPGWLDRFRAEVRLARQVSHPNVCRVHDILESDDRVMLTMEYVDGEDLGSLLRRIGRLPQDKAVQIARQICLGLAAAHERGVLHRDLKPANIMIDGRGNARLMDFGVAGLADELAGGRDAGVGTPAYMSPEQLARRTLTARSDLYALGLVLHELFTGARAFSQETLAELRAARASGTRASSPSAIVRDLDPAVERVILRCLEPDPLLRPPSALAVAASLPGGDPLAAALAAGETPSPELVALSGSTERMSPLHAGALAASTLALLALCVLLTASHSLLGVARPERSAEVLEDRARETLRALGHDPLGTHGVGRLSARSGFIPFVTSSSADTDRRTAALARRPGPFVYWYRHSPLPLISPNASRELRPLDPFPVVPGEVTLITDTRGRLERLVAAHPRGKNPASTPAAEPPDWPALFRLADLDFTRFSPASPNRRPPLALDSLFAFDGSLPEFPDQTLRVHAGFIDRRLHYFAVDYPWDEVPDTTVPPPVPPSTAADWVFGLTAALILLSAAGLAWRNVRSRRGDRQGALRVALLVAVVAGIGFGLRIDAPPRPQDVFFRGDVFAFGVWVAVLFWLFYVALEPYARRVLPSALISWARLLRGGVLDPLVGRHLLIGSTLGSFTAAIAYGLTAAAPAPPSLLGRTAQHLSGAAHVWSALADECIDAVMVSAGSMLILVLGMLMFRRLMAACALVIVVFVLINITTVQRSPIDVILSVLVSCLPIVLLTRTGLLSSVAACATLGLAGMLPIGPHWSGPGGATAWIPALGIAALLAWASWAATRGRSAAAE
ncbi:MAG: serine/threonine protein kinase [Phycisphaerae bacterium]|nr:serine/threonine protein kinase [Phycisphaerae bacterium]